MKVRDSIILGLSTVILVGCYLRAQELPLSQQPTRAQEPALPTEERSPFNLEPAPQRP